MSREIMQQALDEMARYQVKSGDFDRFDDVIKNLRQALAQPEQASTEPPDYVEPPTSDYHNGWEEGFEAAKNLFKKESAPQNADPRLLLGRKDNCIALAQPEQIITPISPDQYERLCGTCGACTGKPWVGLTEGELIYIKDCNRGFWINAAKIEQLLKDKNT